MEFTKRPSLTTFFSPLKKIELKDFTPVRLLFSSLENDVGQTGGLTDTDFHAEAASIQGSVLAMKFYSRQPDRATTKAFFF